MDRALLIVYEPALFLVAALAWAGWEFWSMRTKKEPKAEAKASESAEPSKQSDTLG